MGKREQVNRSIERESYEKGNRGNQNNQRHHSNANKVCEFYLIMKLHPTCATKHTHTIQILIRNAATDVI